MTAQPFADRQRPKSRYTPRRALGLYTPERTTTMMASLPTRPCSSCQMSEARCDARHDWTGQWCCDHDDHEPGTADEDDERAARALSHRATAQAAVDPMSGRVKSDP